MSPLDSRTIKYLALSWAAAMLVQVGAMLQVHRMDWWALGSQTVVTLAAILTRIAQPDVQAPAALNVLSLGLLNRNNPTPPGVR